MGKHPEDRFDTGADMAEALRQVLAGGRRPTARASCPRARRAALGDTPRTPPPREDSVEREPSPATRSRAADGGGGQAPGLCRSDRARPGADGRGARPLRRRSLRRARAVGARRGRPRAVPREVASLARPRPPALPSSPSLSDSSGRSRGRVSLPEQELERAQAALTQFVGPIARVLVRRAAANASSVEVLWQALSTHIEQPAERAAFLRQRPS